MMKKSFLLVMLVGLISVCGYGQDSTNVIAKFNKWSIDAGIGLTKPYRNFTSGYWSPTPGFLATEIGARYMVSETFGVKLGFGYNQFQEADKSLPFKTNFYRLDLEGVSNLGRVMQFETWTKTIGLLAHAGFGVGMLDYTRAGWSDDYVGNVLGGLTAQVKLSDRIALNLDGTAMANAIRSESLT